MTFGLFVPRDAPMQEDAMRAFASGLDARKIPYRIFPLDGTYTCCGVAVTFGVAKRKTARGRAVRKVLDAHRAFHLAKRGVEPRHIVVERGFIHRDEYFMVGWNGLNGRADFCNQDSPRDRWDRLHVEAKPWRKDGLHIVLCGQVPWDASVQHTNHVEWCRSTAANLRKHSDRPIVFRPHPLQPDAIDMSGLDVELSSASSLLDDLRDAWAVVTFNSNAGVEATLAGIPAFAADRGAMGYPILNKDLTQIESPRMPAREQWMRDLAYTQWTLGEIAKGDAIYHLWERYQSWPVRLGR